MKALQWIPMLAALVAGAAPAGAGDEKAVDLPEVRTVASVDLVRYAGLWHQIALIPNRFQDHCVGAATAEYELREDGKITVVNRCTKENGEPDEAEGVAKIENEETNAELKVSFVDFLGWRPFWGDYWVLGLDEGYDWAAVGTPDRKYGWILARTPTLDDATLDRIFAIFEQNGYDRQAFEMSPP